MTLLLSIFIISSCYLILCAIKKINDTSSPFLSINFWKNKNFFTTSHTSKQILKLKYSVNYKTSVLLLLIIVAKKSLQHFWKMMSIYTFSRNRPIRNNKQFFKLLYPSYVAFVRYWFLRLNIWFSLNLQATFLFLVNKRNKGPLFLWR